MLSLDRHLHIVKFVPVSSHFQATPNLARTPA